MQNTPGQGHAAAPDSANPPQGSHRPKQGTSIARANGAPFFSPARLEERRLVSRADTARSYADAFRELRTPLLALGDGRNFVALVAPVTHGCGGSFVARNLATALAFDESKSVLLVDCDARHPCQQRALDIADGGAGLIDYLQDQALPLDEIVRETGVEGLSVITAGKLCESSSEYFDSQRMRTMIDSLRAGADTRYLVLDSPPVLGAPDARILGGLVDFVVLVVGHGVATAEQIDKAAACFPREKLAGVVFNDGP